MPEMRPFEGVVGEGKGGRDTEGQRTRNVEELSEQREPC